MSDIMTLPEKLAREIARVTEFRSQVYSMASMPSINVRPLLFMIDESLERAKKAAGSPNIEGQIRAVRDLEGYTG